MGEPTYQANRQQFIALIKEAMIEQHLSNNRLAQLAGIAESTVRKILKDDGDIESIGPHPQVVKAICRVLNLDVIAAFQLLDYLPTMPQLYLSDQAERIGVRYDRLPKDKQTVLVDLLDSLEKSANLGTPDITLEKVLNAVRQLRREHPMFEKRKFNFQDELGHLSVRFTPSLQIPPMRKQIIQRFKFVFRDDLATVEQVTEQRLDELLQHSLDILALQMLLPRKDIPSALEKLYWLCFWDKAYGISTVKLADDHQQGFRALWVLLNTLFTFNA